MEDLKVFEQRKKDHIRWALSSRTQDLVTAGFSDIGLVPEALPEINFSEVDLSVHLLGQQFSSPHFISSMTAGHKLGFQINSRLAEAAGEKNWLFCVGSQKKDLFSENVSDLKKISSSNKKTKFVSNIGLEEAIEFKTKDVLKLVETMNAVGIIIHLNALQEVFQNKSDVVMKEGLRSIEKIVRESSVPVIVKEVGFGISEKTLKSLFSAGVSVVDVAGHGGTHWGMIEALRQKKGSSFRKSIEHFSDWGLSTATCLLSSQSLVREKNIWASGGIRSGVDSAKCLALGAKAVGIAQPLLKSVIQGPKLRSPQDLISTMEQFDFELKTSMFCMGIKNTDQFLQKKVWYEK